jgi:hypothetical protein
VQLLCVNIYIYIYIMVCGGGTFWFHKLSKPLQFIRLVVNKTPPNFNTLFALSSDGVRLFKGLTVFRSHSVLKG